MKTKEELYRFLGSVRRLMTRQQYSTIKGQIRANDLAGAYKGILKVVGRNEL